MSVTLQPNKKRGFTIVELLIVIVVIAILAAISIVAYNGIQTRAENTKTIDGVAAYTKLFSIYAVDNGTYPATSVYPSLSTAVTSGKIAGTGGCAYAGQAPNSTAFYDLLTPYATTLPSISQQTMSCNGETYRGAYVNANSTNAKALSMPVYLKGAVDCPSSIGSAKSTSKSQADQTTLCIYAMPTLP